jgi:hypothetical protein
MSPSTLSSCTANPVRFPIYSVFLPIYSFWSMDDFSWGSTRKVIGEGNNKTIVYEDDMPYDDSMIPMKSFKGKSLQLDDGDADPQTTRLTRGNEHHFTNRRPPPLHRHLMREVCITLAQSATDLEVSILPWPIFRGPTTTATPLLSESAIPLETCESTALVSLSDLPIRVLISLLRRVSLELPPWPDSACGAERVNTDHQDQEARCTIPSLINSNNTCPPAHSTSTQWHHTRIHR